MRTFTEKLILKSFKATGIVPLNPDKVLDRFTYDRLYSNSGSSTISCYSGESWRVTDRTLRCSVKDPNSKDNRALRQTFHHLLVDNQLLKMENERLREALKVKKKQGKEGKALPLIQRKETHAKTQWWSPSKVQEACFHQRIFARGEEAEKLRKVKAKKLKESNRLLQRKLGQEKREKRVREREEQDQRKAQERKEIKEGKAQRERGKQACNAAKAVQLSQRVSARLQILQQRRR